MGEAHALFSMAATPLGTKDGAIFLPHWIWGWRPALRPCGATPT